MASFQLFCGGEVETIDDLAAALTTAREVGGFVWVTLDHPDTADFAKVERVLGLHPLAVEDAVTARDRPKLDAYDTAHFLSLITLRRASQEALDVGRVMAFLGDGYVVTVRQESGDTLARVRQSVERSRVPLSPLVVLHAVLDTVVDDLAEVSSTVEAEILASAERLFAPTRSDEAHVLYLLSRDLLAMAHAVRPLIEPLRHLSSGGPEGVDVETAHRFQDVLDHALVVDREIRDDSTLVEHLRNSNDSRIALEQNTDMRKIAAWAAVIAVPTAITSFYGMNVPYPGFGDPVGLVTAVVAQVVLAVSLFVAFRRREWL
jgi:magnesium transporter